MCLKPSFCILESFGVWQIARRRREKKKLPTAKFRSSPGPYTYCLLPKATRQGFVWDEIELVANESSKGTGLLDLPKDLCIPYGGIYRSPRAGAKDPRAAQQQQGQAPNVSRSIRAQKDH